MQVIIHDTLSPSEHKNALKRKSVELVLIFQPS